MEYDVTSPEIVYASIGRRALAKCVDLMIGCALSFYLQFVFPFIGPTLVFLLYFCVFLSSTAQATPGKRLFEIYVTDESGRRPTFKAALIRSVFDLLLLPFVSQIVALFTPKTQALHDVIASTVVVRGRTAPSLLEAWTHELTRLFGLTRTKVMETVDSTSSEREKLDLLERLNRLRQTGAITEEEYQRKKAELLK